MRELPIELARPGGDWTGLIVPLLDPRGRQHLAVIAGGEDLVGLQHLAEGQGGSCTSVPARRNSPMIRWRVMPLRKVWFGTGV
jgi:hypothetical protein